MIRAHTVQFGESLALIASKYGFPNWETVYQHPLNKPLRQLRPHPKLVYQGDVVLIPDKPPVKDNSFSAFLEKVMALEEAALQQKYSFQDRVTAFRLIYYGNRPVKEYGGTTLGGGPWTLIIPGAAHIQQPSSWQKEPLASMVLQLKKKAQVVEVGSTQVDVGHLLTGLDARLRPSKVTITVAKLPALQMRSNQEAATYVGDLGSVVAKHAPTVFRFLWQKVEENAAFKKAYASFASEADQLGNIDSYSMSLNPQRTVAQNLLDYYLAPSGGARKRFSTFLKTVNPTAPASRQALEKEIFVAAQFVLAGDKNIPALMDLYQTPTTSSGMGLSSDARISLERPKAMIYSEVITLTLNTFIAWCQKKARSE